MVCWRGPLLRALAAGLIVDEGTAGATHLLAAEGGEGAFFDLAAQLRTDDAIQGILVIASRPGRLEQLGILPTTTEVVYPQLAARGVDEERIQVVPCAAANLWDAARCLGHWLDAHPGTRVAVAARLLRSRRTRWVLDAALGPDAARVTVVSLPELRYNEGSWWRCKEGVVDLYNEYLRLGYVALWGEETVRGKPWDPDAFEKTLR